MKPGRVDQCPVVVEMADPYYWLQCERTVDHDGMHEISWLDEADFDARHAREGWR